MSQQRELFATDVRGDEFPTSSVPKQCSEEAYAAAQPKASRLREQVFAHVKEAGRRGHTTDEIEALMDRAHQAISPRIWELHRSGRIRPSGERRTTRAGRNASVWVVADRSAP